MATNKSLQRCGRLLLTAAMSIAAVIPARAGDWMPLLPDQNFYDFQLFAPPDLQDYEIYPEQSEGIFFNYDRLYWGITPPRVTGVCFNNCVLWPSNARCHSTVSYTHLTLPTTSRV